MKIALSIWGAVDALTMAPWSFCNFCLMWGERSNR
jgi:hypothetical protein